METTHTFMLGGIEIIVTETSTASVVRRWLKSTLYFHRHHYNHECLVVGLGVQWTPNVRNPPADTLQLCIGRRCLIFHLCHAESVPIALRQFLYDPTISFVGFWNHSDRSKLEHSWPNLDMCRDPYDLRIYAATAYRAPELQSASVRLIVNRCLGFDVERSREVSMSDWGLEYLSRDQVLYACVDAYCAFLIGKDIQVWNFNG